MRYITDRLDGIQRDQEFEFKPIQNKCGVDSFQPLNEHDRADVEAVNPTATPSASLIFVVKNVYETTATFVIVP